MSYGGAPPPLSAKQVLLHRLTFRGGWLIIIMRLIKTSTTHILEITPYDTDNSALG
jgi:hypothetical protein